MMISVYQEFLKNACLGLLAVVCAALAVGASATSAGLDLNGSWGFRFEEGKPLEKAAKGDFAATDVIPVPACYETIAFSSSETLTLAKDEYISLRLLLTGCAVLSVVEVRVSVNSLLASRVSIRIDPFIKSVLS